MFYNRSRRHSHLGAVSPEAFEQALKMQRSRVRLTRGTPKIDGAVHVLHAFQKKTQRTRMQDIDIAKRRLKEIKENFYG